MDEFAELEAELMQEQNVSTSSLQHILNLLANGELEVDYTIKSVDEVMTTKEKWQCLAFGIILAPIIIGFFLIWFLIKDGSLNSPTHTKVGKYYLGFCHSILEYEYKNEQLIEAKLTNLDGNSYVYHEWIPFGDNGGQYLAFYIHGSGNNNVKLGSVPETITGRKENFQKAYRKVKDFCEISGLKNVSSIKEEKKYAKWITEMS